MKKRKIVMSVLIVTMLASCMACGNIKDHKGETLKNSVTEKVTVSDTEVAEDTENIEHVDINTVATEEDTEKAIESGNTNVVTPETEKSVAESNKAKANDNAVASKPAEKPAKKPAGNTGNSNAGKHENNNNNGNSNSGNNNANAGNNGNGNSGNNDNHNGNNSGNNGNNKPTEKPHVHKYVEISRTDPTCTADGVITKKCSCGDVITEPNGKALGHNMVHHDAVTHTEQKLVKDAYDEPIYKNGYQCNVCGKFFNTDDEAGRHVLFECTKGATYSTAHNVIVGYTHHDAVYETVTITDVEAYDECSRCGAR